MLQMRIRKSSEPRSISSNGQRSGTRRGVDKNQTPFTRITPLKSVLSCFFPFHISKVKHCLICCKYKTHTSCKFPGFDPAQNSLQKGCAKDSHGAGRPYSCFSCLNGHCQLFHSVISIQSHWMIYLLLDKNIYQYWFYIVNMTVTHH